MNFKRLLQKGLLLAILINCYLYSGAQNQPYYGGNYGSAGGNSVYLRAANCALYYGGNYGSGNDKNKFDIGTVCGMWLGGDYGTSAYTTMNTSTPSGVAWLYTMGLQTPTRYAPCDAQPANALIYFTDPLSTDHRLAGIHPNGNVGCSFTVISDNSIAQASLVKTNTVTATIAIVPRLINISSSTCTAPFNINGGMKVRIYYDPIELINTQTLLDPAVTGSDEFFWFKYEGTPAGLASTLSPTTLGATYKKLIPTASGTEDGVSYVEFSGIKNFSTFGAGWYRTVTSISLPVTLARFEGAMTAACKAKLSWETKEESRFTQFVIEYSPDGSHYREVGTVAASGINSGSAYNYSYDQPDRAGYYRLKMVDADGGVGYSKVIVLSRNCDRATGFTARLYPNPSSGNQVNMSLTVKMEGRYRITVYGNNGQLVQAAREVTVYSSSNLQIATAGWSRGVYRVVVSSVNSGETITLPMTKL